MQHITFSSQKTYLLLFLLGTFSLFLACETDQLKSVSKAEVFDELWTFVQENYVYFDEKEADWNEVRQDYEGLVKEDISDEDFFFLCVDMLNELKDVHNSITSPYGYQVAYNRRIGYEIHFDLDVVKANYLNNDFQESGFYTYGVLENDIGYIHFADFKEVKRIHSIMDFMEEQAVKALIIDVRDNSGGYGPDAVEIVGHFINQPTDVGYIVAKTGPRPDDFSEPRRITAQARTPFMDVPVVMLTNRESYSATSYLAAEMKPLPNVTLVGQITGGGGGGNITYELSNTWLLTVSLDKYLDINMESIEAGVLPDIEIVNDSTRLANGIDEMLERAVEQF